MSTIETRKIRLNVETMEERIVANAVVYSAATIRNETSHTMNYYLQWQGSTKTLFSVPAGYFRVHSFPRANAAATISFDWSYQAGFQERSFSLTTRDFIGSSTVRPTRATDGLQYYHETNNSWTGVNFYADFTLNKSQLSQYRANVNTIDPQSGRLSFPRLMSNFEVMAAPTNRYNCIAWSLNLTDRWVNPVTSGGSNPLAGMDQMYATRGYARMNSLDYRLVDGFQKVVVYAKTNWMGGIAEVTHAAIQARDGSWSSKLGANALVKHTIPEDVAGNIYGVPVAVYVRRI